MEILEVGEKLENIDYDYRETAYGIVDMHNGKLMMVYTEKDKNYSLPGGGIDEGETPEDAIKREFIEETGLKIKKAEEIVQVHCYWNTHKTKNHVERFSHIFMVEVDEMIKSNPLEKWHKCVYVDKKEASKFTPFPYQQAGIEYYINKFEG